MVEIPDGSFEFLHGLDDKQVTQITSLILSRCQTAFSKELEFVPLEARFDCTHVDVPFIGVTWFKKIKWEQIHYVNHRPRNCIMLVSNIGLNGELLLQELEQQLKSIGGDLRILNRASFGERRYKLYRALYTSEHYKNILPIEKNPLKIRRMK